MRNLQTNGFFVLHNFFKDALLQKIGFVKVYYDETEEAQEEEYPGLSDDELTLLLQDSNVEIVSQNTEEYGEEGVDEMGMPVSDYSVSHDVVVKRMSYGGMIKIDNIPPEEFLVSKKASSIEDADLLAQRTPMTVSDLRQMGYARATGGKDGGYARFEEHWESEK